MTPTPHKAMRERTRHIPVLLQETIDNLNLQEGNIFLDGTLGGGGHTSEVLERFPNISVIALDRDSSAISRFKEVGSKKFPNSKLELVNENFRNLDRVLADLKIDSVDAILLDLGVSSDQLDSSERGFSFQRDEPLSMSMSLHPKEDELTAEKILNTFSEDALELIIRGFGEEKYSKRIAKQIVEQRGKKPFRTTFDLLEAVLAAVPASYKHGRINPATRTFQAIRIAVNEELQSLEEVLPKALEALRPRGRLVIISFHSLGDRMVKNFFRESAKSGKTELMTKKPITPSEEEIMANPRSRSAKLRVITKI